ncbi:MAG: ABC transporter ATP-binding protein [Capsulimonadaceae bacterium]
MAQVILNKVTKQYAGKDKVLAVDKLSLDIQDREFMVLVGPSGCGKTTALRMIAGLEEITEGQITIGARIVNDVAPKDRDIAMVFQSYALYPHMSVYQNMAFGLELRKVPKADIQRRVREAAELLGITDYLERKPKELSGGQRQRVALGRAIVREPQVFLMDEPLSNLDAKLRVQTRAEIIKLHRRLGITTVYVTHDQVEAMTMGNRIAVMNHGVLQQVDTPMNIYNHPVNKFVAGFIGTPSMNFIDGTLRKQNGGFIVDAGAFKVSAPPSDNLTEYVDKPVTFGVRPSDIFDKNLPGTLKPGPDNTVRTQVEITEPMGDIVMLNLLAGNIPLVATPDGESRAKVGEAFDVVFDISKTHLFDPKTEKMIV